MLAVSVPLGVTIAIVGALLSVVGGLIVLNLKSIKNCLRSVTDRLNKQESRIDKTSDEVKALQINCERTFVPNELFLRETGFARRSMENATASINRVEGKLDVVDKLPQICGDISREIVKQMQSRGDQ